MSDTNKLRTITNREEIKNELNTMAKTRGIGKSIELHQEQKDLLKVGILDIFENLADNHAELEYKFDVYVCGVTEGCQIIEICCHADGAVLGYKTEGVIKEEFKKVFPDCRLVIANAWGNHNYNSLIFNTEHMHSWNLKKSEAWLSKPNKWGYKDIKSMMFVSNRDSWTTAELHTLNTFGAKLTERHLEIIKVCVDCNYFQVEKEVRGGKATYGYRKRTWETSYYKDTFEEVIEWLEREVKRA